MNPSTIAEAKAHKYGAWAGDPKGSPYRPGYCVREVNADKFHFCQCGRLAKYGPEKQYCKQHDPETIKAKEEKERLEREKAWKKGEEDYKRRSALAALAKGVPTQQIIDLGENWLQKAIKILAHEASSVQEKFDRLVNEWKKEATRVYCVSTRVYMHPAYQRMIGMGVKALPLIFEKLKSGDSPSHWFWALEAITEVNPAAFGPPGGEIVAWLSWGNANGYTDWSIPSTAQGAK